MIWAEKRTLLIILGLVLAANIAFFFTYRVQYQSRLDELDTRLETSEKALQDARTARLTAERQLQAYRKTEQDVALVLNEHWSTQTRRFTPLVAEVKRLAIASSLIPDAYSFAHDETKSVAIPGAGKKDSLGATEVTMSFTVLGTYQQVRRLINLLELSQQFVIIDSIQLAAAQQDQTLTLNLRLKTLFRDDSQDRLTAANRL